MSKAWGLGLMWVCFLLGCHQNYQHDPHLQAAYRHYQSSLALKAATDSLRQTVVFERVWSQEKDYELKKNFRQLDRQYKQWLESLVDVPGFEAEGQPRSLLQGIPSPEIEEIHQTQLAKLEDIYKRFESFALSED